MAIRNWVGTLKSLASGRHMLLRSTATLADSPERIAPPPPGALTHAGSAKVKFLGVFIGLVDDSKRKRQYEKALEKRRRVIHRLRQLQKQRQESWEKEVGRLALNAFTRGYRKTLNTLRSGSKAKQAIFDKATELGMKAALTLTDEHPLTTSDDLKRLLAQEEDHFARLGWEYLPASVKAAYENLMLSIEEACAELKSVPPTPRPQQQHAQPTPTVAKLPELNVCHENVFHEVSHPEALQAAYERVKPKLQLLAGKSDDDWHDVSSFDHAAQRLRSGRYRFSPVSEIRVRRPGKETAPRVITVVSVMDQVVAEAARAALERIYAPLFHAHRYKLCASTHTALKVVKNSWKGTTWFVHYKCPIGRAHHENVLRVLASRVKDDAFLCLLEEMLKAGVSERLSAVLCNVYFLQLDMEVTRMQEEMNAGSRKRKDVHSQGVEYTRVRYVRYGDEFLFGVTGSKAMAMEVVDRVQKFLKCELKMQGS